MRIPIIISTAAITSISNIKFLTDIEGNALANLNIPYINAANKIIDAITIPATINISEIGTVCILILPNICDVMLLSSLNAITHLFYV